MDNLWTVEISPSLKPDHSNPEKIHSEIAPAVVHEIIVAEAEINEEAVAVVSAVLGDNPLNS